MKMSSRCWKKGINLTETQKQYIHSKGY